MKHRKNIILTNKDLSEGYCTIGSPSLSDFNITQTEVRKANLIVYINKFDAIVYKNREA